ncbi:butyrophilin subfamily 3 member A1-like isoform X1 [Pleurodeles waltl]
MLFWALIFHGGHLLAATPLVSVSAPIFRARLEGDVLLGCTFMPRSPVQTSRLNILWYHYSDDETHVVHHYSASEEGNVSVEPQHPLYHGRALMQLSQIHHGNVSLELTKVTVQDAGLYRCIVNEASGMAYAETVLEVYAPYQIGRLLLSRRKETIYGACEFSQGYPQAELEWHYNDGSPIDGDSTQEVAKGSEGLFRITGTVQLFHRSRATLCCSWKNSFTWHNNTLCQSIEDVWMSQKRYTGTWAILFLMFFLAFCVTCHNCCNNGPAEKKRSSPLGWRCLDPKTDQEEQSCRLLLCHSNDWKIVENSLGAGVEIVLLGLPLHTEELLLKFQNHKSPDCLFGDAEPLQRPLHTMEMRSGLSISVELDFEFIQSYLTRLETRYSDFERTKKKRFAFVYSCADNLDGRMKMHISSVFGILRSRTGSYPAVVLIDATMDTASDVVLFFRSFDAHRLLIVKEQKKGADKREIFQRFLDVCLSETTLSSNRANGWQTQNESML